MAVPGTHILYGATGGDFIGSGSSGGPLIIAGGINLMVWTPAGVQVTDLYSQSEDAVTTVTADDFGNYRFYALKNTGPLMVSVTSVSTRYAVFPVEFTPAAAAQTAAEAAQASAASSATSAAASSASAATSAASAAVSAALRKSVVMTQAAYNALTPKAADTIYHIVG